MPPPPDPRSPLGRVDRYELLAKIGQGSFGGVYRARHVHTGQFVALKLAQASLDPEAAARILAEGRAASSLRHPNVVGVLDCGVSETGDTFVVMELLEGRTLAEIIRTEGPLLPERALMIALAMLDGIAAAHDAGVTHRDIKPSNVFVSNRDIVTVIDFGISKLRRASRAGTSTTGQAILTIPGIAMGTPGYMAPEQLVDASAVDARADVYSVGATIYEMLSKRRPFEVSGFEEWMRRVETEAATPLASVAPHLAPALCAVVDRALARDRDARWPTARALRVALDAARTEPNSAPYPSAPRASAPQPSAHAAHGAPAPGLAAPAPGLAPPGYAPAPVATFANPPLRASTPTSPTASNTHRGASSHATLAWTFAAFGVLVALVSVVGVLWFLLHP